MCMSVSVMPLSTGEDILQLGLDVFKIIGENVHNTPQNIYIYRTFNIAVCLFTTYFIIANCFREKGRALVDTIQCAITVLHVLIKYVAFMYGKAGISTIVYDRKRFWDSEDIKYNLAKRVSSIYKYTKIFEKILLVVFIISVHFHFLKPLFNSNTVFPFNVRITYNSLVLHVLVLAGQYYCLCIVIPTVLTFDITYFSICVHLITELRLLKHKISELTSNAEEELGLCVGHHQLLSSIFSRMQQIYSTVLLIQYLMTIGMICVQLYMLNIGHLDVAGTIELVIYIVTMYGEFGYYSIPVEEISFEFVDIGNAVYKSLWYEENVKTKRALLILMTYAYWPRHLSGAGLITINANTFGSGTSIETRRAILIIAGNTITEMDKRGEGLQITLFGLDVGYATFLECSNKFRL